MQDFMRTVYRQMRLASSFEIVNHAEHAADCLHRWRGLVALGEGEVSVARWRRPPPWRCG